jgi:hypothetical protein
MLCSLESNASVYGVLKGKVLDSDGKPAIGASVRVLGTTRGAQIKNVSGEFTIVNIIAGNYEVLVSYNSVTEFKKSFNIIADSSLDIGTIKLNYPVVGDEIVENLIKRIKEPKPVCHYPARFNIIETITLTPKYTEEIIINKRFDIAPSVSCYSYSIFGSVFYYNPYIYSLTINEIKTYNYATAKFGILENLSFTAGVTQ